MTTITLRNGVEMPMIGLGTLQSSPEECLNAIHAALDAGYTLIDTASISENEEDIGKALEAYFETGKLSREDVFIITRFWFLQVRPEDVEKTLLEKLKALRTDYVDLYVTHQPKEALEAEYNETDFEHTWKAMEEVYQKEIQDIADFSLDILQVDEEWFYEAPHVVDLCVQLGTPVTTYILHESPEMMKVVAHRGRGFFNSN
ncbi:unnamed protein product [Bursaphelenchus xylophilus]|uniref:(pine wood nematode) hypothetical protein n=1 Tax=Bursaphelenchus xylophilus TaxID=6326 RepID=A0A7I8X9M4_BURXY|nr:unnamed protein product [Bursaphelenchus xylophilus]CAG9132135.1 unnamed protein product [Bursaphelenchus xylophilus]